MAGRAEGDCAEPLRNVEKAMTDASPSPDLLSEAPAIIADCALAFSPRTAQFIERLGAALIAARERLEIMERVYAEAGAEVNKTREWARKVYAVVAGDDRDETVEWKLRDYRKRADAAEAKAGRQAATMSRVAENCESVWRAWADNDRDTPVPATTVRRTAETLRAALADQGEAVVAEIDWSVSAECRASIEAIERAKAEAAANAPNILVGHALDAGGASDGP